MIIVEDTPATFAYKQLGDLTLYIDVYPPTTTTGTSGPVPAVVFFHGGGMTAGDRTSWLPKWLCSPCSHQFAYTYTFTDKVHIARTHDRCESRVHLCRLSAAPTQHGARCAQRRRRPLRVPRPYTRPWFRTPRRESPGRRRCQCRRDVRVPGCHPRKTTASRRTIPLRLGRGRLREWLFSQARRQAPRRD